MAQNVTLLNRIPCALYKNDIILFSALHEHSAAAASGSHGSEVKPAKYTFNKKTGIRLQTHACIESTVS